MIGTRVLDQVALSPGGAWSPSPPGGAVADVAVIVPRGIGPVGMEVDGRLVGILGSGQISSVQRVATGLTLALVGSPVPAATVLVQGTQWPAGCEPSPPMQQAAAPPLTLTIAFSQRSAVAAGAGPSVMAYFPTVQLPVGVTGAGGLHLTSGMASGTVQLSSTAGGGVYREATYSGAPLDVALGADEVASWTSGGLAILLPSNSTGAAGFATVRWPIQV